MAHLRDLGEVARKDTAETVQGVLEQIQMATPQVQAVAVAVVFKLVVEKYNVKLNDLLAVAGNMLHSDEKAQKSYFLAVRQYVREEL